MYSVPAAYSRNKCQSAGKTVYAGAKTCPNSPFVILSVFPPWELGLGRTARLRIPAHFKEVIYINKQVHHEQSHPEIQATVLHKTNKIPHKRL